MQSETLDDILDSIGDIGEDRPSRQALPGLLPSDIESLKLQGNPVAALALETTDKEYRKLARYKNVHSFSILSALHSCARRYILEKDVANTAVNLHLPEKKNIDFVFGHAVGAGVQALFAFEKLPYALYATFISWNADYEFGREDYIKHKRKTIETATLAIEQFSYFRVQEIGEWEIFRLPDGRPAIEISFCINLGNTKYFGHIDLILRHRRTGKIAVGEIKTTGYSSPDEASYRNSGQAIGYALVLDRIVGVKLADYEVMYFVYPPTGDTWVFMPFPKSASMKMEWIQDRLIDAGHVNQYHKLQHFPKNGANCKQFNRRCAFFGECDLVPWDRINELPVMNGNGEDVYKVDYYFDVAELMKTQVERIES